MFTCSASHLRLRNILRPYLSNLCFSLCACCLIFSGANLFLDHIILSAIFGIIAIVPLVIGLFAQASLARNTIQANINNILLIPCASGRDLLVLDDNSEWHFGYRPGIIETSRQVDDVLTFYCITPHNSIVAVVNVSVRYLINPRCLTQNDRKLLSQNAFSIRQLTVCAAACFTEALSIKNDLTNNLTYNCHDLHVINRKYQIDTTISFSSNPDFTYIYIDLAPLFCLENFRIYPQKSEIFFRPSIDDIDIPDTSPIIRLSSLPALF